MVIYLGSLVQLCCRERGTLQTQITGVCGECSQCLGHTGFAPASGVCVFPVYTVQAPGCSAGEMSKASPGLHELPKSKLLRFSYSGSPQRRRLGWACILCPSQVRAAQVMKCLASMVAATYRTPIPATRFSGCTMGDAFSGVPCVSSGELISGCNPPGQCLPSRIPRSLG